MGCRGAALVSHGPASVWGFPPPARRAAVAGSADRAAAGLFRGQYGNDTRHTLDVTDRLFGGLTQGLEVRARCCGTVMENDTRPSLSRISETRPRSTILPSRSGPLTPRNRSRTWLLLGLIYSSHRARTDDGQVSRHRPAASAHSGDGPLSKGRRPSSPCNRGYSCRPYWKGQSLLPSRSRSSAGKPATPPCRARPAHLRRAAHRQRLGMQRIDLRTSFTRWRPCCRCRDSRLPIVGLGDADGGLAPTDAIHGEAIVQAHHFPPADVGTSARKGACALQIVRTERDIADHAALPSVECSTATAAGAQPTPHSVFLRCWIIM